MPAPKALLAAFLLLGSTGVSSEAPAGTYDAGGMAAGQFAAGQLEDFLEVGGVVAGFATLRDGRRFVAFSRIDGSTGPQVVAWVDGQAKPFPDGAWNSWHAGSNAATGFVGISALRVGPHGALWIVDVGAPGFDQPKLPGGPKVVKVDPNTGKVTRVFPLDDLTNAKSRIDDIRFHGDLAYITDAGSPGIIVLNLTTGAGRRVLDGDLSLTAQRPIAADEHILRRADGAPVKIHADQLEVSPDGKFIYYQPASGPMSRVATRYIDDPKLTEPQLSKHVTTFSRTGSTSGTAIDADGRIYCSDTEKHRIWRIDPDGTRTLLIEDPRLIWVDAMWIDDGGYLYLPATQLDRMAPFNGGASKVQLPVKIYRLEVGAKPSPTDHP